MESCMLQVFESMLMAPTGGNLPVCFILDSNTRTHIKGSCANMRTNPSHFMNSCQLHVSITMRFICYTLLHCITPCNMPGHFCKHCSCNGQHEFWLILWPRF